MERDPFSRVKGSVDSKSVSVVGRTGLEPVTP